jgi:hypothetical protein
VQSLYYLQCLERFSDQVLPSVAMTASEAHRVAHVVPTMDGFLLGFERPEGRPLCGAWKPAATGPVEVSLAHARMICSRCFILVSDCLQSLGALPDPTLTTVMPADLAPESVTGNHALRFRPVKCDRAELIVKGEPGKEGVQLELVLTDDNAAPLVFPVEAKKMAVTAPEPNDKRLRPFAVADGNDWRLVWSLGDHTWELGEK